MSATGSRSEGGFSIIECLAVLAITGLAGAVAFPSLEQALGMTRLVQSKQALIAHLQQARGEALAADRAEALSIAPDGRAYGWNGVVSPMPPGVKLSADDGVQIVFLPDGSASPGRLTLNSGTRQTVIVVSSTGAVTATDPRTGRPTR